MSKWISVLQRFFIMAPHSFHIWRRPCWKIFGYLALGHNYNPSLVAECLMFYRSWGGDAEQGTTQALKDAKLIPCNMWLPTFHRTKIHRQLASNDLLGRLFFWLGPQKGLWITKKKSIFLAIWNHDPGQQWMFYCLKSHSAKRLSKALSNLSSFWTYK